MGTYTEITYVHGPSEAAQGEKVSFAITVHNKHSTGIYVGVTAALDGIDMGSAPVSTAIPAGGVFVFDLEDFTMPGKNLNGEVATWYWGIDENWHKDDSEALSVSLAEETPQYDGDISEVFIRSGVANWNSGLPIQLDQGDKFSVAFTGVNQSNVPLVLCGEITVIKPSGATDYDDDFTGTSFPHWEDTVGPGESQTFKWTPYGQPHRFVASQKGEYTAQLVLKGKRAGEPDSQYRQLASWRGKIVVASEPEEPPEEEEPEEGVYDGRIENKMVDWTNLPGGAVPFPTIEPAPVGEHIRVSFEGVNLSTTRMRLRAEVWLYGPGGRLTYHDEDVSTASYDEDESHKFVFPTPPTATVIDEAGEWSIEIQLTNSSGEYLLDQYQGALFSAEEAAPSSWGVIVEMMPLMMVMMMFSMMMPMMKELEAGGE